MKPEEVVQQLRERGYLVTPEAFRVLSGSQNPEELARIALENATARFVIEPTDFEKTEKTKVTGPNEAQTVVKPSVIVEKTAFKPLAKEVNSQVRLLDRAGSESSMGSMDDFVHYFQDRYEQLSQLLKTRGERSLSKISDLKRKFEKTKIICIICEKKVTKNGHVLLIVEDDTGTASVLIPSSNQALVRASNMLVHDEVIAIDGRQSRELFIADAFYEPDLPVREAKTTEEDVAMVMLSDIHVGSKLFMRKNFEAFLSWIKGGSDDPEQRELASKVKYVTIAGDCVDGIGVYPGQERELEITDIYEQYGVLSKYIQQIPEYIHVVIAPGDHDAVKKADPQPPLPKELVPELYGLDNVSLIGSPGTVELHGLKTLIYHGTSFIDFIGSIPTLNFETGSKIMVEMLKKRHVHPAYGDKPITPDEHDRLIISEAPDIFHTGESHNNSYDTYKGTLCINSGTWQQITEYIIRNGQKATPCILPYVDMRRGKIKVVRFDKTV